MSINEGIILYILLSSHNICVSVNKKYQSLGEEIKYCVATTYVLAAIKKYQSLGEEII